MLKVEKLWKSLYVFLLPNAVLSTLCLTQDLGVQVVFTCRLNERFVKSRNERHGAEDTEIEESREE